MSEDYSQLDFVIDETKAKERFLLFSSKDPLPEVPPALLNSGDVYDYARITSMVFPFDKNNENKKLKSASYEIDFLGDVYYVNEETTEVEIITLENHKPFTLKKNSIAFLYIKTKFFLPDYIAIRFNLKITHVHRGLLLGTGPLVDPGFVGRLLIPLHNLTSEDYVIKGGDGLIWVEFTKLSPHRKWSESARRNSADYRSFPTRKIDPPVQEYFNKASPPKGDLAKSSIPGEIKTAKQHAEQAEITVSKLYKETKKWAIGGVIVGVLSILIAIFTLGFQTWDLISTANQNISYARDVIENVSKKQIESDKKIESLEAMTNSLIESLEQGDKEKSVSTNKNGSKNN